MATKNRPIWEAMNVIFKAHPWHSVNIGDNAPEKLTAYIEVVPSDTVKYELDKSTGLLKVDRPQKYSNICPALYGLIPQTHCADNIANFCMQKSGLENIKGDDDPLDICVLTEKDIPRGDLLVDAIPIGGIRMIDDDEADDKIIAVLKDDLVYGAWTDISVCPNKVIDRLVHYFETYKEMPGKSMKNVVSIEAVYGRDEAHEVIRCAQKDYHEHFGEIEEFLTHALYDVMRNE
jgi:inorganic pyrophosphatase